MPVRLVDLTDAGLPGGDRPQDGEVGARVRQLDVEQQPRLLVQQPVAHQDQVEDVLGKAGVPRTCREVVRHVAEDAVGADAILGAPARQEESHIPGPERLEPQLTGAPSVGARGVADDLTLEEADLAAGENREQR